MRQEVIVEGMKCDGCAQNVSERFSTLEGVERVLVDREAKNAVVEGERAISKDEYAEALSGTKYQVVDVK